MRAFENTRMPEAPSCGGEIFVGQDRTSLVFRNFQRRREHSFKSPLFVLIVQ